MVKLDHARRRQSHEKVSKWTEIENKHEKNVRELCVNIFVHKIIVPQLYLYLLQIKLNSESYNISQ